MYQILKFDSPIPSCSIYALEYNGVEWEYLYALNTPFELTNNMTESLIIYEYISDLKLKEINTVHKESVNIIISSLDQYLEFLNKQRESDIEYRKVWIEENKAEDIVPSTIRLENRSYDHAEISELGINFISGIYDEDAIFTDFIAI